MTLFIAGPISAEESDTPQVTVTAYCPSTARRARPNWKVTR
jgi:hypothetical protein